MAHKSVGPVVLLALGMLAVSCAEKEEVRYLRSEGVFVVDGKTPRTPTGYEMVPGYYYLFRHIGGAVCFQDQRRCAPPQGNTIPGEEAWGLYLDLPDGPVNVRDGLVVQVESPAPLVFYIPEGDDLAWSEDKAAYYEDNSGAWKMEVLSFTQVPESDWVRGVSVTSYTATGYCSGELPLLLRRLQGLGANAVQYVVIYETDGAYVYPTTYTQHLYCLSVATDAAKALGLKVVWNLHVDQAEYGSWRGALQPTNRDAFFESYGRVAEFLATVAQVKGVDAFVPATEMVSLTEKPADRNRFLAIFLRLHEVFFGELYYAADRSEYDRLGEDFWRACCDAVGITAWFALTDDPAPPAADLEEQWKPLVAGLERLADDLKMRIYFPEGPGYRAVKACAEDPADYVEQAAEDPYCQGEAYKAFVRTFRSDRRQVFAGQFVWEVVVPGEAQSDYSPLDRPAEGALKEGWKER